MRHSRAISFPCSPQSFCLLLYVQCPAMQPLPASHFTIQGQNSPTSYPVSAHSMCCANNQSSAAIIKSLSSLSYQQEWKLVSKTIKSIGDQIGQKPHRVPCQQKQKEHAHRKRAQNDTENAQKSEKSLNPIRWLPFRFQDDQKR